MFEKKLYLVLISVLLLIFTSIYFFINTNELYAQNNYFLNPTKDIRMFNWGASVEEVLNNENAEFVKEDNKGNKIFKVNINDISFRLKYFFTIANDMTRQELSSAIYINNKKYKNKGEIVDDFYKLSDYINNQLNNKSNVEEVWKNEKYKTDNEEKFYQLILDDYLELNNLWFDDGNIIEMKLFKAQKKLKNVIIINPYF